MNRFAKQLIIGALVVSSSSIELCAKNVGVVWFSKSSMAQRVLSGMREELKKSAPEVKLEFKINQKNEAAAVAVYNEFQKSKDAIVFLRSSGAKAAFKNPSKIPVFIGAANNPKLLGVIQNMDAPEGYITGVTYFIPHEKQIDLFIKALPSVKSIGLLVQKGHPSAPIDQAGTKAACDTLGLAYKDAVCSTKAELLKNTRALSEQCDMIIIGSQNMVMDNTKSIMKVANKIPVAAFSEKPIKNGGALFGMAANDKKLGQFLAQSIIDVLKNGKKVASVPVKTDPEPSFIINVKTMKKLGITIPDDIKSKAKLIQ